MSSKMREALGKVYAHAYLHGAGGRAGEKRNTIAAVASRYGPLEFTREEARGIGKELWMQGNRTGKVEHPSYWCEQDVTNALSRHLGEDIEQAARKDARESFEGRREALERGFRGESESDDEPPNIQFCGECLTKHRPDEECNPSLDREVGELHGELIALTKRVAAIEKALLARGHTSSCMRWRAECTCGHDQIQKPDPGSRV